MSNKDHVIANALRRIFDETGLTDRFKQYKKKYDTVNPNIQKGNMICVSEFREGNLVKSLLREMREKNETLDLSDGEIETCWEQYVNMALQEESHG